MNLKSETALAHEMIEGLKAENARLKAELELLRPKPAVKTASYYVNYHGPRVELVNSWGTYCADNLKLTFTNGVLTGAEVVG